MFDMFYISFQNSGQANCLFGKRKMCLQKGKYVKHTMNGWMDGLSEIQIIIYRINVSNKADINRMSENFNHDCNCEMTFSSICLKRDRERERKSEARVVCTYMMSLSYETCLMHIPFTLNERKGRRYHLTRSTDDDREKCSHVRIFRSSFVLF